ncbi:MULTISPECIES: CheR family methyltransferase [Pseudomonas]|uniref:CheR family methyltransferase n=2 Tax=Pseudomonas TaxID=286 RepID=UPI00048E50A1|nr:MULTISPECIES: CheR family methyltransferase [Pseudomonas]MBA1206389.1 response regulator [Pseudomonas fulva]MBA1216380.1 response regulator [Pseudomonas fulva]MDH0573978.1 ATP-binding protein [Pseudomonas fulva]RRW61932.1 response regulator [Pseudomonas fulva]TCT85993.1 two-component system CheB/CheR fusion protein [Pseudomonas sp. LP_4_YM]
MKSTVNQPAAPHPSNLSPSHLNFPVVGIGASAGGIEAICTLFRQMPADSGMAFVIVLHLSPDHQSVADRIIQETTGMPVSQVTAPVPIERNHVYVISPANRLSTNDGYLRVAPANRRRGDHVAIDLFFRDLADVHKDHAFCVVLSGTGADGAVGLARVKEQGGVTLVQSPDDAQYDSMPRAAIETGLVDVVLPAAELAQKLMELWHNARQVNLPRIEDDSLPPALGTRAGDPESCEPLLEEILLQLRSATGHDFQHYKRATVLRRIERRLHVTGQADLRAYLHYLENHKEESADLLADMLIGVTNFFRDREAFEALERIVMPQLVGEPDSADNPAEIRIWSAGCSTGEESYSLAMLTCEQLAVDQRANNVQVFATDLDERAIGHARTGLYPESIITDVPPSRLRQFFVKEDQHYRVRKEIREKVLFARHNLLSDPPFSQLGLIVCRNLLIYLDREIQRDILRMFHFALRPGGYLFLGSSESAELAGELFAVVDKRNRIYRAREVAGAGTRPGRQLQGGDLGALKQPATAKSRAQRKPSYAEVHHRALARRTPPSLIIDGEGTILHLSEGVGRFMQLGSGELSRNLLNLVLPSLRLALRSTLFQARQGTHAVTSRPVDLGEDDQRCQVEITVQPHKDEQTAGEYLLVVFEERAPDPSLPLVGAIRQTDSMVLNNLERELQRTRLQLQETIEQSEISSEELTASNEEMQTINEELRSASEELETSKEELQSINEELLTVNYELKNKVEETDKVNDYLRNLIASTDIAAVFVDRNLHIRWFTPRATDLFNMLPVDTGRSLLDITHRLDYPALADDARAVVNGEHIIEREIGGQAYHWYLARLLPYRSSEQKIDGAVLTFIDISKSRAAEERLRLGEERMRVVAESTHEFAIILLDEQGLITDWNTGATLIFGHEKADVVGRHYQLIFTEEDRQHGIPEQELQRARTNGRSQDERWHMRNDDSRFYASGEISRLKGNSLRGFVKIARDLTGHKRLHDEQSKQLAESQSSSHMKDEFFAIMSHELKHPLNLIQLNAEILRRLPSIAHIAAASKAVATIREAVASQARIIDDLLDVARIRTGKLKLKTEAVDVAAIVEGIHGVVVSEQPDSAVVLELPADRLPLFIDGDSTRLEQVIWNLLNNALKFSPPGSAIRLSLSHDDTQVSLSVIDQGIGLTADSLEHIFDLFSQAASPLGHAAREGLGIGLSLVRQLVEAHGGSVSAYSAGLGQGCTFTVTLPLSQSGRGEQLACQQPERMGRLDGLHVLLVDDSPEVLDVMQQLLEMECAQVSAFADPRQALEVARDTKYDVILSDIGMPVMDGHALIKALRNMKHLQHTPAIALTGYGASADQHRSKQSGFDRHLNKPVGYDELVEAIESLHDSVLY